MDDPVSLEPAAANDNPSRSENRRTARLVRTGVIVCAAGLVVTVLGAWRISSTRGYVSPVAQAIHTAGMLTMLAGFTLILLSYRTSWLKAAAEPLASLLHAVPVPGSSAVPTRPLHRHRGKASMILLAALFVLLLFSIVVLRVLPNLLAGLYIIIFHAFLAVAVLVTLIYGNSSQRTFCIGAILPLGIATWQRLPCDFTMVFDWIFTRQLSAADEWETLATFLELCGVSTKLIMSAVWTAMLLAGLCAVILRRALHYLNGLDVLDKGGGA